MDIKKYENISNIFKIKKMTQLIDFIKWCFRDETSGAVTFLFLGGSGTFIINLVKACRKKF
jgi:hypothetical protein